MKLVKLILSVAAVTVLGAGLAYADGGLMGRIWGSEDKPDAVQEKEQGCQGSGAVHEGIHRTDPPDHVGA